MPDKVSREGAIKGIDGLRGVSAAPGYQRPSTSKPRRNAGREAPIRFALDELELRAYGSPLAQGSVLERIVAKRLSIIWGKFGIDFVSQEAVGDRNIDCVIYNRPSGKRLALEIEGAHWHGAKDFLADSDRDLFLVAHGYDFSEIWEWEIRMGDEYLDARLLMLIGGVNRAVFITSGTWREWRKEIPTFARDLEGGWVNPA